MRRSVPTRLVTTGSAEPFGAFEEPTLDRRLFTAQVEISVISRDGVYFRAGMRA